LVLSFQCKSGIPCGGLSASGGSRIPGGFGGRSAAFRSPILSFYVNPSSIPPRSQAIPASFPVDFFPAVGLYWATRRNGAADRMARAAWNSCDPASEEDRTERCEVTADVFQRTNSQSKKRG
jgi:hypothetical protein